MLTTNETRHDAAESRRLLSLRLAGGAGDHAGTMEQADSLGLAHDLNQGVRSLLIRLDIEPALLPIELYASQCLEAGMAFSSGLLARGIRHIYHCDGTGLIVFHLFMERGAPVPLDEAAAELSAQLRYSFRHQCRLGGVARGPKEIGEACLQVMQTLVQGPPAHQDAHPAQAHMSPKVREVVHMIEREEAASELTIGGLAAAVGITPAHLSRIFQRDMGLRPLDYLTNCRLDRAKQLLRNRDLRVHDVALQSGFESTEYFARVFRRRVGMTPTAYRGAPEEGDRQKKDR